MPITRVSPPLNYLYTASRSSLQSFELAHLNHAANIRREIGVLIDQWIEESAQAMLARCIIDNFSSLHQTVPSTTDLLNAFHDDSPAALPPSTAEPSVTMAIAPPHFAKPQPKPLRAKSAL
jgi:hypothetical protein